MKRLVLGLGLVAIAAITAACSGGSTGPSASPAGPAASPAADAIVVVSMDLKFLTAAITAPAGEAFQIVLDNQEAVPHNIAIKDASGAVGFKGEIVTSAQVVNEVPALPAGTYEFFCELHPDMKGSLTAG